MNDGTLDTLLAHVTDQPVPLSRLALLLLAKGHGERARELCARAVAMAPDSGEVHALAAEVFSHEVPRWYFPMVQDTARHKIYERALRRVIRPGHRVLDIGSGTGLFAMMAARAGAAEVITCEVRPNVAAAVVEVVARNGLSDQVRVVPKRSSDLEIGIDLDGPVDVIVWDNLSNDLIGAGALSTIEQAARRLGRLGARFVPASGTIRVALAEDREPQFRLMDIVEGFDLSPFNRLAPQRYQMPVDDKRFVLRSEPQDLLRFNFESGGPFPEARAAVELFGKGGRVNGISQWLRLQLDEVEIYENSPPSYRTSALGPVFHRLISPIELSPGQRVLVHGAHDRQTLRIWGEAQHFTTVPVPKK